MAVGPILSAAAAADSNLLPILITLGGLLLGGGGVGGVLIARAQSKNYVQTGYRDLTGAYKEAAAAAEKEAADERASKERAEYRADRWRAYSYALRDELAAAGIVSKAIPPTDHPSETR